MTPIQHDRNDTKLMLAALAVVLSAGAGVALWVGLTDGERDGRGAAPARTTHAIAAVRPAAPGPGPIETAAFEGSPRPEDADILAAAGTEAEAIRVDPTADFVEAGLAAYRAGEYPRAVAYLEAEVAARPDRAWTLYLLGLARWKQGDLDAALLSMQRSAELAPGAIKTFVNLARIRNDRGEFEEALEAAEAAVRLDAADTEAQLMRARSLHNLGQVESALEAALLSVQLDPDNGYARNLAGLIYIRTDRARQAVEQLEAAVEQLPDVAFVRNNLGMALELDGRFDEAVTAYRQAAADDPSHARAVANLARLEAVLPISGPAPATEERTEIAASVEHLAPVEDEAAPRPAEEGSTPPSVDGVSD